MAKHRAIPYLISLYNSLLFIPSDTNLNTAKDPAAEQQVFDPRGSRQMCIQACPLGSLFAGINSAVSSESFSNE